MMENVLIIAEAGVNHNGNLQRAKDLISAAADSGADYVKFQTFKTEKVVTKSAKRANYQNKNTGDAESQFDMIKKLELSQKDHLELIEHSKKKNIKFLSTGFDLDSLDFLNSLDIPLFKIPSGEITNLPYLRKIASFKKPVVMSTGMANIEEVKESYHALLDAGLGKKDITIVHCNTEYPTPMEDVNLKAMLHIRDEIGVKVGYSDHTLGIEVPIAAVALGATVIEKHFTLDRDLPGPDHLASLEPLELKTMVTAIRNIEKAISGSGKKEVSPSEKENLKIVRKSIVALTTIQEGEIFSPENVGIKRPGGGISPMEWDSVIGSKAKRNYNEDELI